MSYLTLKALRHMAHSVTCKLHQWLPLPRKRSPDGASPDWGCGHLIAAYYSFIYPERMKGWVGLNLTHVSGAITSVQSSPLRRASALSRIVSWRSRPTESPHWPRPLQNSGRRWRHVPVCCQWQWSWWRQYSLDESRRTGTARARHDSAWTACHATRGQHWPGTLHLCREDRARPQPSRGTAYRLWYDSCFFVELPLTITLPHRIILSWYTGCWWVDCYIWYSEEGLGVAAVHPGASSLYQM